MLQAWAGSAAQSTPPVKAGTRTVCSNRELSHVVIGPNDRLARLTCCQKCLEVQCGKCMHHADYVSADSDDVGRCAA